METVWKYPIPVQDEVVLSVPEGAHPLSVQVQNGELCVWMFVSSDRPLVKRVLRVAGTGHALSSEVRPGKFIGTVQLAAGMLVFHVFDLGTRSDGTQL